MSIKGIIFDFDGVVSDSVNVKTEAFAILYEHYGKDIVERVVKYHLEHGGISRYEKFKYFHKHFLGIDLSQDQISRMGEEFSRIALKKVIDSPYIKGAVEFLEKYSKLLPLFICTGTPEAEIRFILDSKKLSRYFKCVYGAPKSKNEIIRQIQCESNLNSDNLVFIGDAMTDYNAAAFSNIRFIGIASKHTRFPEGTEVHSDFTTLDLEHFITR